MTTIKKQAKSIFVLLAFMIVICGGGTAGAVEKTWTGLVSTEWSNGDNWDDFSEPNSFSDVVIPDANTTSRDPAIDTTCYCNNISIKSGGILNGGSNVLNVSGNWTNNGTFNAGTGGVIFTGSGDSTIAGTNATAFYNLQVQKTDTNSVFLTTNNCSSSYQTWVDSGTLDFSVADVTFTCDDKIEFSNGGLSSKLTMDAGDLLDCLGSFVFNSGAAENITGGTIYIESDFEIDSGASFTPTGGVVVFDGAPASDINCMEPSSAFYDLEINKSPGISATAQTNVMVSGNFTITSGIFDSNGFDISVAGDWTNNDTLDPDYSKVTFYGTSTIDSGGTGAGKAFYNVELNGTSATLSTNDIDIDGNFTITSGTWNTNGLDMYVAGSWTNNGTFTHGSSTVILDGTSTVNSGGTGAGKAFYNVELNGTSATLSTNDIDIDGDLTITSGTLNIGGQDTYVGGNWTNNGTFNPGTGTVTFDGSGDQTVGNAETFYGLTINKGGGALRITDSNTLMVNGAFTITGTTPTITGTSTGGYGLTLNGDIIVPGANINYANPVEIGGSGSATFNNVSFADFIDFAGSKFLYVTRTSLVETFDGCSFGPGPNGIDRYNVHVNASGTAINFTNYGSSGGEGEDKDYDELGNVNWTEPKYWTGSVSGLWSDAGNWSPSGAPMSTDDVFIVGGPNDPTLNVTGNCKNITIDGSGTLSGGSNVLNVYGNWTNDGTFIPGSGTVTFNGSGSLISGGTSAGPFHNLTVSSGTRQVMVNNVKVDGKLTIDAGAGFSIMDGGLNLYTGEGGPVDVDIDGTLTLEPSSGSGGIYWFVNEGSLVDLDSGGTLTLHGFDDSNRVYLRSSAEGVQWYLNDYTTSAHNPSVEYVDVRDCNALGGNTIYADDGTNIDSGNNINWIFTPVIFVDANAPAPGPGDGTSWYDAYKYLQDALAEANSVPKPVEIWVAQQTYTPDTNFANPAGSGDRKATFQLISGVGIYGGFPSGGGSWAQRKPQLYETTLSGDLDSNDVQGLDPCDLLDHPSRAKNSYHVIAAFNVYSVVLEGFHIIGGNANGLWPDCNGGGLYSVDSNITVANCSFSECSASSKGGAMFTLDNHPLEVRVLETTPRTFCPFSRNTAAYGGAIYNCNSNSKITNCTFADNTADANGGGIYNEDSNSVLTGCAFIGNSAVLGGGGMYNRSSNTTVTNCTFRKNAASKGSGMYNDNSDSPIPSTVPTVTGTSFEECNITLYFPLLDGGGIYNYKSDPNITNCTFTRNSVSNKGGGIYNNDSNPIITNCILWGNTDGVSPDEQAQIYDDVDSSSMVKYSCVEGLNIYAGNNNIGDNPLFLADIPDQVRLLATSPCIDAGDNNSVPVDVTTDIEGHPRITDGDCNGTDIVDMGAYEFDWVHIGDFAGGCDVDFVDFAYLAITWQKEEGEPDYDYLCDISIPADSIIDERDLKIFTDNWLAGL